MSQNIQGVVSDRVRNNDWAPPVKEYSKWVRIIRAPLTAVLWLGRHKLAIFLSISGLALSYNLFTVMRQPVAEMSFAHTQHCVDKFTAFPGLHKKVSRGAFNMRFERSMDLFGVSFGSRRVCVEPNDVVNAQSIHTVSYSLLGNDTITQKMHIASPHYPVISTKPLDDSIIGANASLELSLSEYDAIFDYRATINDTPLVCEKTVSELSCPLQKANLKQNKAYTLLLERMFNDETVQVLYDKKVKTAEPVSISDTSIKNKATLYEPVDEITIRASHDVEEADTEVRVDGRLINAGQEINGKNVILRFTDELPWRSDVTVVVAGLKAKTGAALDEPYILSFKTSGGPKIVESNLTEYLVRPDNEIDLSFDQPVVDHLALRQAITLKNTSSQESIAFTASVDEEMVRLAAKDLKKCTSYTLVIDDSIENFYGVAGDSEWDYTFKTLCADLSVIGTSVQGKEVLAYSYGDGAETVVFVGAMHGSEASSRNTLTDFIHTLEEKSANIPSYRKVVVIPDVNPDGTEVNRRTNHNGVDLNRNFPANDWQSLVYMPGNISSPTGGGDKPLSEPESAALARYVSSLSPRLVLTYHAVASVVIGNGSGDSDGLANEYARLSGYDYAVDSEADDIFQYETTGEFEDWLHDKLNIPTLLVELSSMNESQFAQNQEAMWRMVQLPELATSVAE